MCKNWRVDLARVLKISEVLDYEERKFEQLSNKIQRISQCDGFVCHDDMFHDYSVKEPR